MHATFFQTFWPVVGPDIMAFISDWWRSGFSLEDINSTVVTLIPKIKDPTHISEFRPISLCNVIYKMITKVLVNRLKTFLDQIISHS